MKTINLIKYGFIRSPEADFSDDGSRFTCYRVGNVRISKSSYQGEIFIAGRYVGIPSLLYEEYSKLPHYKAMDDLNGVDKARVTEEDIRRFYQDCVAYDREYKQALSEVVYPTAEEIIKARGARRKARQSELSDLRSKMPDFDKILRLSDYDLKSLKDYYSRVADLANPADTDESFAESVKGSAFSRGYVSDQSTADDAKPSFYYREAIKLLKKAGVM